MSSGNEIGTDEALWRQDFRRFLRGNYRAHKIKNTNIYTTQITTQ